MDEVAIDEDQRGAVVEAANDVVVPDLGVKGARAGHARRVAAKALKLQAAMVDGVAGGRYAAWE
jgi:hypothetical protein